MNLREGTRRLALLLGTVGAILGGLVSYLELQSVWEQWGRHNKFEQLANSSDVQKERKCRLLGYESGCFQIKLPAGATLVQQEPQEKEHGPWDKYADGGPAKFKMEDATPLPTTLNSGGVKTVNWTKGKGYVVESLETEGGETLYPTLAPAAWEYLLIVFSPVLGFFIPWGVVRSIGWVGAGFAQPKK